MAGDGLWHFTCGDVLTMIMLMYRVDDDDDDDDDNDGDVDDDGDVEGDGDNDGDNDGDGDGDHLPYHLPQLLWRGHLTKMRSKKWAKLYFCHNANKTFSPWKIGFHWQVETWGREGCGGTVMGATGRYLRRCPDQDHDHDWWWW